MMIRPFHLLLLLCGTALLPSCKKEKTKPPVVIDATLTACPEGTTCQYKYTDNAEYHQISNTLRPGSYRVFWMKYLTFYSDSSLYFMAPRNNDSFELSSEEIAKGRVVNFLACTDCNTYVLQPVGGYVKGTNTTPNKPVDQAIWLLEAKLYMKASFQPIRDTVELKQYFYPTPAGD